MRGKTSRHWSTHRWPSPTLPQMLILPSRRSDRHTHAFHSNHSFRRGAKGQAPSLSATFDGPCHPGMLRCCVSKQRLSSLLGYRTQRSYHHSRTWAFLTSLKKVSHGDTIVPLGPKLCVRWSHHAYAPSPILSNHLDRLDDVIGAMDKL